MKLLIDDIEFSIYGFQVQAIKKLSDKKLEKLEDELSDIYQVHSANIDDIDFLTISWLHAHCLNETEKEKVLKIINKIYELQR